MRVIRIGAELMDIKGRRTVEKVCTNQSCPAQHYKLGGEGKELR